MSQAPPDTDTIHPRILLSATLSTSTLSLSQASPASPPITLNLQIRLADSPIPITLQLPQSALSPNSQGFYRSYYHLTSQTTGQHPRQMHLHGLLGPRSTITDPDTELLTLYPDSPAVEIGIPIGIHVSPRYQERKDEGANALPYLAVAATPLAGLVVGERYVVGLKDVVGEFPGYVWWWDFGEREEVVGRRVGEGGAGRGFAVPVVDAFGERRIRVEMGEGPGFVVVE
ncbi:hypothetical protein BDR22DRAFT_967870 [Usnea florida]